MTYAMAEVFKTLQGEGRYSGHAAIFVRFSGCNMWSGHDRDRDRDAERSGAKCPKWCDTDFLPQFKAADARELMDDYILQLGPASLVVFTGGEPLLQLDSALVEACNDAGYLTCVETNGTVRAKPGVLEALGHICISPKRPESDLHLFRQLTDESTSAASTELKVVLPAYDPAAYERVVGFFDEAYVSPEASTMQRGRSVIVADAEKRAVEYCLRHPAWSLSLQTHKHLELP